MSTAVDFVELIVPSEKSEKNPDGKLPIKKCTPRDRAVFLETKYREVRRSRLLASAALVGLDKQSLFNELDAIDQQEFVDADFITYINGAIGRYDAVVYAIDKTCPGRGVAIVNELNMQPGTALIVAIELWGLVVEGSRTVDAEAEQETEPRPSAGDSSAP